MEDGKWSRELRRALEAWQASSGSVGCCATVIDGDRGEWSAAAGARRPDSSEPMPAGEVLPIFSITKTFVAATLLRLGVQLDAPFADYVDTPALPAEVTVRRLLNHTAGIPNYTAQPDYAEAVRAAPSRPWTRNQVIERCCGGPLDFAPGTAWRYSNTGYMLLCMVIEALTGSTLREAVAREVTRPLGLNKTAVMDDVGSDGVAPTFTRDLSAGGELLNATPIYHPGWCLTGLIASTTEDVARFFAALLGGQLLAPELLAEMTTPVDIGMDAGPFYRRPCYGLGLMIDPGWGHGGLHAHGGGGPGANTWAMHLPNLHGRPFTLTIFCNTDLPGTPEELVRRIVGRG